MHIAKLNRVIQVIYGEVCTHASCETTSAWESFRHRVIIISIQIAIFFFLLILLLILKFKMFRFWSIRKLRFDYLPNGFLY